MPGDTIKLTIEGPPGETVQVWHRGNAGDDPELGDPAPIVFTGEICDDGRVTIEVPRKYLVLGRPTKRGALPMRLDLEQGEAKTVQLPPAS
ncbi:MAG TPA: hypothetical protein VFS60_11775 [Thermoanaerobaculia bacterium]|nr:hypothetical protein [Thermoanaerobaculia bacterium]